MWLTLFSPHLSFDDYWLLLTKCPNCLIRLGPGSRGSCGRIHVCCIFSSSNGGLAGGWVWGVMRPLAGELASVTHVSIIGKRKAVQKWCQVTPSLQLSQRLSWSRLNQNSCGFKASRPIFITLPKSEWSSILFCTCLPKCVRSIQ